MTDTPALAAIHKHVDAAGAKLLLVGDHRQLAAVGAGGGMDLLATTGASYELADARRFREPWERDASLRLRTGDQTVLADYHRRGRLVDGGAAEQAEASACSAAPPSTRRPWRWYSASTVWSPVRNRNDASRSHGSRNRRASASS